MNDFLVNDFGMFLLGNQKDVTFMCAPKKLSHEMKAYVFRIIPKEPF